MEQRGRESAQEHPEARPTTARSSTPGALASGGHASPAQALALQRTVGNRAARGVLARQEGSQVRSPAGAASQRGRAPDISARGYHTFYLPLLANGGRGPRRGFVAQFHATGGSQVSAKVSWLPTMHLQEGFLDLPSGRALAPRLLDEGPASASFDLDGDGRADLEVTLVAGPATGGIEVIVTAPGQVVSRSTIRPPGGRRVTPYRGIEFGRLPNGRPYYMQPWTSHLPGGPIFVDDRGWAVNPGRERANAEVLSAAGRMYLISYAVIAAAAGLAAAGATTAGAATIARGAATVRWLFSGSRLMAGGTSAAANLASQALEHGGRWDRYNWGSVGFDYVLGAVSYSFAKGVVTRWPAPLFSKAIASKQTWINLGKQQAVLNLYGLLVGLGRAQVSNTPTGATVGAQYTEGGLQAVKSVALQSFLMSPQGKAMFPRGWEDPRIVFLSRSLGFVVKFAARELWGVTPQAAPREGSTR